MLSLFRDGIKIVVLETKLGLGFFKIVNAKGGDNLISTLDGI